jgi:hypothetical protein
MADRPFPKEMLDLLPPDIRKVFEELSVQMWTPGDKVDAVICVPVEGSDESVIVKGSTKVACFECHALVWISPATWATWKKMPGTPIRCIPCVMGGDEEPETKS